MLDLSCNKQYFCGESENMEKISVFLSDWQVLIEVQVVPRVEQVVVRGQTPPPVEKAQPQAEKKVKYPPGCIRNRPRPARVGEIARAG